MSDFRNRTVLITGAAMGLGRLMAERSLAEGAARVVLWDINESALTATAEALRAQGHTVYSYKADVSSVEDIERVGAQVLSEVGPVDILFNNAGIVVGRPYLEHSREDIERTIRINVLGVMHVARVFLPGMVAQGRGHLINIASAAGLINVPKQTVYCSSKWAVLGWSEALRIELEQAGIPVQVTTVCPSYIDTGMFAGARAPMLTPILKPDYVVNKIFAAVLNDRIVLRLPAMVNLLPLLKGVLPVRVFDLIAGNWFGVYSSMNDFKGRGGAGKQAPQA